MSEYEYNTNTSSSGANIDCSKGSAQEGDNIQSFCYKVIARLLQLQGWFNGLKTSNVTENSTQALTSGGAFTALATKQNANTAVTHTASTAVGSAGQPVYITANGVATAGDSIPVASSMAPADPASAAAVGTSTNYARADHVHKAQTNISGNAATATALANARTISLSGGATGTATSFNGTANITIPVTALDASKLTGTASVNTTGNAATSSSCTGNAATSSSCTGNAATASKLGTNAGSGTKPVYFANGVPVACGNSLAVSVTGSSASCTGNAATSTTASSCTGNAATATTATNATYATYDSSGNSLSGIVASGSNYIKFKGGFIIQWGRKTSSASSGSISFSTRFTSSAYGLAIATWTGSGHEYYAKISSKHQDHFSYSGSDGYSGPFDWIACGF